MKDALRKLCCLVSTMCPLLAWAGFDEALKSYQARDYAAARTEAASAADAGDARASLLLGVMVQAGQGGAADAEQAVAHFEKAARGGIVGAYSKLAQAYSRGAGVAKDRDKALGYARKAASLGDPEGAFFLSVLLTNEYLSYMNANGKSDDTRYFQLAKRPLSERSIDTEAQDALYWSADKGFPMAVYMLALKAAATTGDGNRKRMLSLAEKLGPTAPAVLQNYVKVARHMDTLGDSYASPQLFIDTQTMQMVAGTIQTCGIRDARDEKTPMAKLVGTRVSKPVYGAVYLPTRMPGYEKAYLMAGQWEEEWTYTGCERTAAVTVKFVADGFGGAHMRSEQSGKDIPGISGAGEAKARKE